MSYNIKEPTVQIQIDGRWFWLVPFHDGSKGFSGYLLKPVEEDKMGDKVSTFPQPFSYGGGSYAEFKHDPNYLRIMLSDQQLRELAEYLAEELRQNKGQDKSQKPLNKEDKDG